MDVSDFKWTSETMILNKISAYCFYDKGGIYIQLLSLSDRLLWRHMGEAYV